MEGVTIDGAPPGPEAHGASLLTGAYFSSPAVPALLPLLSLCLLSCCSRPASLAVSMPPLLLFPPCFPCCLYTSSPAAPALLPLLSLCLLSCCCVACLGRQVRASDAVLRRKLLQSGHALDTTLDPSNPFSLSSSTYHALRAIEVRGGGAGARGQGPGARESLQPSSAVIGVGHGCTLRVSVAPFTPLLALILTLPLVPPPPANSAHARKDQDDGSADIPVLFLNLPPGVTVKQLEEPFA
jgi:hypothetical protein